MNAPRPDPDTDRAELAGQQRALLQHLVAEGPAPPGFDAEELRRTRELLAAKRRRSARPSASVPRRWTAFLRRLLRSGGAPPN